MAKKAKPATSAMFAARPVETEADRAACLDILEREISANESLEWLQDLRDKLAAIYADPIGPDDDAQTFHGKEAYQGADVILSEAFAGYTLPQQVRRAYNLGRTMERWLLQRKFDGMVNSAITVSRANSDKARKKSPLNEKQWAKVIQFIAKRPRGVSIAEAARQAAKGLTTGTFKSLAGVRLESIDQSTIEKRWRSRPR